MKTKILSVLIIFLSIAIVTGCSGNVNNPDALKFKQDYESLNGKTINDKKVRTVKINQNNPLIYKNAEDIITMMDNNESFVVYFGFSKCPWCRSIIETLIKVSNDLGLDKIYYVDVLNIRDTLSVDKDGNVKEDKKGSNDYYKLLDYFKDVLSDYKLYDKDGNLVKYDEKRIYAPNVVSVVNGTPTKLTTGISKKQNDAYMKLTDKMKKETYNEFKCLIKCVLDSKTTCSKEKEC